MMPPQIDMVAYACDLNTEETYTEKLLVGV